jgi:hypothetical protein
MISALESLGRRGGGDLIRARYIGLLNTFNSSFQGLIVFKEIGIEGFKRKLGGWVRNLG